MRSPRRLASALLALWLLAAPAAAVAAVSAKGEKNYKRGVEHEAAQRWEKAAEEFALAVAADPSNAEYQLHYRRALFNASQTFMQQGSALLEREDYLGAYNAFRRAYGYDPVNELARGMMERTLRMQLEREETDKPSPSKPSDAARLTPTAYDGGGDSPHRRAPRREEDGTLATPRAESLGVITYSGDLEKFIKYLARQLKLNVVFDRELPRRNVEVDLQDVTAAQALDYIFLTQGLFFQKLSSRTILVADQSKRPQYQQLVLRTFYLYNIKPTDARQLLTGALPANAGRQPTFVENANTNSITVRDTPENIRTIEKLLRSVDKDRSEVVMEVSIYEVSRTDLLQLGNQIGDATTLGNLGGVQPGSFLIGGARQLAAGTSGVFPLSTGVGLLIPATRLSALSDKSNTRLIFSTQVHAFDDEKSETRIGEKVPVQTAAVYNGLTTAPSTGTPNNNAAANNVFGNGYPVIQYEDTGLVLDFKPKVYPNQDVQVTMNIETKDAKGGTLTPTFTQRKISGVARIPNGKTMMIASVAQDREEHGRTGLPLVGLIPILGRLFSTPTRNNRESDVVITMTPRVLRAPSITPEDEVDRPTGSMQTPQAPSLEAMIIEAEREEQLARARQLPTNQTIQLPAQPGEEVSFVPAPKPFADGAAATPANTSGAAAVNVSIKTEEKPPADAARPAVGAASAAAAAVAASAPAVAAAAPAESAAELLMMPEQQELKAGERRRVMVFMKTDAPVGLAAATLRFDPKALAVRSVTQGSLASDKSLAPVLTQSVDAAQGVLVVSVAPAAGASPLSGEGLLLVVEVEALAPGEAALQFDANKVHLIATDGRTVRPRLTAGKFRIAR